MVKVCVDAYKNTDPILESYFKWFPYPLSPFQKYAVEGIVTGGDVLVLAHTGSGKTMAAEFAIQYFHTLQKKVIYTSPIKALSNQKFYEFTTKFPDISIGILRKISK